MGGKCAQRWVGSAQIKTIYASRKCSQLRTGSNHHPPKRTLQAGAFRMAVLHIYTAKYMCRSLISYYEEISAVKANEKRGKQETTKRKHDSESEVTVHVRGREIESPTK